MAASRTRHSAMGSALCLGAALLSCLPEDTRPPPAQVTTSLLLAPQVDHNLANGLNFETADEYRVTLRSMRMSFGRIRFEGDDCASYGRSIGEYLRVIDPLREQPQPLSVGYALGTCTMEFGLYPPEDWASTESAGVTDADRVALREIAFPDPESSVGIKPTDGLAGPRGPRGASLVVSGYGQPLGDALPPIEFSLAFQVASEAPPCATPFELEEDEQRAVTIEMAPEQLFGACDGQLLFEPLALAASRLPAESILQLSDLAGVSLDDLQAPSLANGFGCTELDSTDGDAAQTPDEPPPETLATTPTTNYRDWLQQRVRRHLFSVQTANCQ